MRVIKALIVSFGLILNCYSQEVREHRLNIGDAAPPLYIGEWVKGEAIEDLNEGHVYVVEFWATWCRPCIAAMPHLSALASKYRDKATVIGVSVDEDEGTTIGQIRDFVDRMGVKMDYHVAVSDSNRMVEEWLYAFGEKGNGIPRTFVVDKKGRVAWIGHPSGLDDVLPKIVNDEWYFISASLRRTKQRYLDKLDIQVGSYLRYVEYNEKTREYERIYNSPEAILEAVEKILKEEHRLASTFMVVWNKFESLIQLDQDSAYRYGKTVLNSPYITRLSPYRALIEVVNKYTDSIELIPEIYLLGADARGKEIEKTVYPELQNMYKDYSAMAHWYWQGGDKAKAIVVQKQAIENLRSKENYKQPDLDKLKEQLFIYKNMSSAEVVKK